MKKLLALACCLMYMHSFLQPPVEGLALSVKNSGEKNLIKAIATFVNPTGNKKEPVKKINLFSSSCS